jgi:hypothetical protein
MFKPVLGYAANLQNINFIHSQWFVQLLFGYILNKLIGVRHYFLENCKNLVCTTNVSPAISCLVTVLLKSPGAFVKL